MTATGVYYDDSRRSWVVEYDYRLDRQSHFYSKEGAIKCATENGWTKPKCDVLTALRAEVEALQDRTTSNLQYTAYDHVLYLIDKHAREGQ